MNEENDPLIQNRNIYISSIELPWNCLIYCITNFQLLYSRFFTKKRDASSDRAKGAAESSGNTLEVPGNGRKGRSPSVRIGADNNQIVPPAIPERQVIYQYSKC